jgi:selenocysteine lyase/cysteine desulfurase
VRLLDLGRDISEIRSEFPILRYKTYLNSAAHGPVLGRVWDAIQDYWNFRLFESLDVKPHGAKKDAAQLINASEEEICWCSRVTQGFNMVSSMLDFESGDNIVVSNLGYPSNVFVWLPLKEKGVEIRRIEHRNGRIEWGDFEKAIDDNTKVVSISRLEWTTGQLYDMKEISDIAHEHGSLVIDDAYQAVGAVNVDVKSDDVDFLLVGSGKWLCCPAQVGIFYIRKDLIDELKPSYRFYRMVEKAFQEDPPWVIPEHDNIGDYESPLGPGAEKFYRGCVDEGALRGFKESLSFFNELNIKKVQERVRGLSGYLIDNLRDLGLKVNTPVDPDERGGLVTYNTGNHSLNVKSHDLLTSNAIITALRYQKEVGGIRVSTHLFNTEEDIDRLIKVQNKLL